MKTINWNAALDDACWHFAANVYGRRTAANMAMDGLMRTLSLAIKDAVVAVKRQRMRG